MNRIITLFLLNLRYIKHLFKLCGRLSPLLMLSVGVSVRRAEADAHAVLPALLPTVGDVTAHLSCGSLATFRQHNHQRRLCGEFGIQKTTCSTTTDVAQLQSERLP